MKPSRRYLYYITEPNQERIDTSNKMHENQQKTFFLVRQSYVAIQILEYGGSCSMLILARCLSFLK